MADRELQGKAALVTGGSRGIGAAVAVELASRGANVLISHRDSEGPAHDVVAEVEKHGVRGMAIRSDQGDVHAAPALIEAMMTTFGRLDILVNNAGIANLGVVGQTSEWTDVDTMWAVNALGVVATIRAAAPMMSDHGRIITIGSVSGSMASNPGSADYCATKAAVAGYTRGVARDLGPRNITVNVIESGMVDTDMARDMAEDRAARVRSKIALGRFGDVDEMAATVAFLASPGASYITGSTVTIDGGFSA